MTHPTNYVCIERGPHFWLFSYDEASRIALLDLLSTYAADPALPFEWSDCAEASRQIHELTKSEPTERHASRFKLPAN